MLETIARLRAGVFAALATLMVGNSAVAGDVPSPDDWRTHIEADLLPFWESAAALGSPVGNFPGQRCNDGTLPDAANPCPELAYPAVQPLDRQRLIALSRQVYSYAVAFHLTGDPDLLDAAIAGSDRLFEHWVDPESGLFFEYMDPAGTAGPLLAQRQSAKQAYGLLGPVMLYLVARDTALLERIEAVETRMNAAFRDGAWYSANPGRSGPAAKLADHLDHLNAYLYLLALIAPEPGRTDRLQDAMATARFLQDGYFDGQTGLYRRHADAPQDSLADAHFGYSAKTIWFTEMLAREAGDMALVAEMIAAAARLFPRALDPDRGAWRVGLDAMGAPMLRSDWWASAELTQLFSVLAVARPEYRDALARVFRFWREHMVDAEFRDTWQAVDLRTLEPVRSAPKHWEWKAGFHAFEQALVGYLSGAAIAGVPATVYVAGEDAVAHYRAPFGFSVDSVSVAPIGRHAGLEIFSLTLTGLGRPGLP